MAQVEERLPGKCEALSSNPNTAKNKQTENLTELRKAILFMDGLSQRQDTAITHKGQRHLEQRASEAQAELSSPSRAQGQLLVLQALCRPCRMLLTRCSPGIQGVGAGSPGHGGLRILNLLTQAPAPPEGKFTARGTQRHLHKPQWSVNYLPHPNAPGRRFHSAGPSGSQNFLCRSGCPRPSLPHR
jgi:hypothetical protein